MTAINNRLVTARLRDGASQVIRNQYLGNPTKKVECIHMRSNPVEFSLRPRGLGVGVITGTPTGNKHLRFEYLTRVGVNDGNRRAAIIDEEFFTGYVDLTH